MSIKNHFWQNVLQCVFSPQSRTLQIIDRTKGKYSQYVCVTFKELPRCFSIYVHWCVLISKVKPDWKEYKLEDIFIINISSLIKLKQVNFLVQWKNVPKAYALPFGFGRVFGCRSSSILWSNNRVSFVLFYSLE